MHALERRTKILEMLQKDAFLSVEEVQQALDASPATIRRDFAELAERMLVVRGHGGVHRLENAPINGVLPFSRRKVERPEGKNRIAKAATGLLREGDIVIIDGGTTTVGIAQYISPLVRIITNSLPLASALNEPAQGRSAVPEVNMTGGSVYPRSEVLLGPLTVKTLKEFNSNWAFLGANGITNAGVYNSNNLVADTQKEMIERAQQIAILADSTKLGRLAMVKVCELTMVDVIVTDEQPPADLVAACAEADVKIVVA
jgi:DeoR/GlpR family transcriptional regulator of sugar metabolism